METHAMTISRKKYEKMKGELASLKLTVEVLSDKTLVKEIHDRLNDISKGSFTRIGHAHKI